MAKQIIKEKIPCGKCPHHYNPSMDHLDSNGNPILCYCRKQKYMVLINAIEKNCSYNEK